jgi:hypothetical protein
VKPKTSKLKTPVAMTETGNHMPQVVTKPLVEALDRRILRMLTMVHELHKAGYQRLRISPGIGGPGAWRCLVTPISNTRKAHGAITKYGLRLVALHLGAAGNKYFDWDDAKTDTARELASKFIERFPEIARAGIGEDWAYAGWYVEMLGFAERGDFPIAFDESFYYQKLDPRWLPTTSGCANGDPTRSHLPMPPGGEA